MISNDHTPQTRAEAREPVEFVEAELVAEPDGFMPLGIRRGLYILGLAGAAIAPVLAVTHPEYAAGIVAGSGVLTAAALGTALANPSR